MRDVFIDLFQKNMVKGGGCMLTYLLPVGSSVFCKGNGGDDIYAWPKVLDFCFFNFSFRSKSKLCFFSFSRCLWCTKVGESSGGANMSKSSGTPVLS